MFFKDNSRSIMNEFPTPTSNNTLLMTPNTVKSIEESILASLEQASSQNNNLPTTPTSNTIIPSTASGSFVPPLPQQSTIILANNWHGASVNYKSNSSTAMEEEEDDVFEPKVKNSKGRGRKAAKPVQNKKKRGRKVNDGEDTSDRRTVRRERNKLAAARCRKRRVDHTNALLEETDLLDTHRTQLQQQIASLQQKKEEFEFLLQAHIPSCLLDQKPHLIAVSSKAKPQRPTTLPVATQSAIVKNDISITTPSNGLWTPSIEGLIDSWSTGLTPVSSSIAVSNNSLMTPVVTPGGSVGRFVVL